MSMSIAIQEKRLWIGGAILVGSAVILGAFGAHAIKQHVDELSLGWWQTAVAYQKTHGLGLLALAALWPRVSVSAQKTLQSIARCFIVGTLLFSGSLYLMTLSQIRILGAITPLGGSLWIGAWGWLIVTLWREP